MRPHEAGRPALPLRPEEWQDRFRSRRRRSPLPTCDGCRSIRPAPRKGRHHLTVAAPVRRDAQWTTPDTRALSGFAARSPPRLRRPYTEIRGFWAVLPGRFSRREERFRAAPVTHVATLKRRRLGRIYRKRRNPEKALAEAAAPSGLFVSHNSEPVRARSYGRLTGPSLSTRWHRSKVSLDADDAKLPSTSCPSTPNGVARFRAMEEIFAT